MRPKREFKSVFVQTFLIRDILLSFENNIVLVENIFKADLGVFSAFEIGDIVSRVLNCT